MNRIKGIGKSCGDCGRLKRRGKMFNLLAKREVRDEGVNWEREYFRTWCTKRGWPNAVEENGLLIIITKEIDRLSYEINQLREG